MKNFFYTIAIAIMAVTFNIQTVNAAFPVAEKPITETPVEATTLSNTAAAPTYVSKTTKAPERMQRDGRGAMAAGAGFGIAALACAVAGLFIFGIPLGICAIVFGAIGIGRRMQGLAIAGIILGALDIIAVLLFLASQA